MVRSLRKITLRKNKDARRTVIARAQLRHTRRVHEEAAVHGKNASTT
jgi:hypothetical protein